jgi:hypothetical protein
MNIRRTIVAGAALLAAITGALAADKPLQVNGDTLVIGWKDGWTIGTPPHQPGLEGAVAFHSGDPKKWRALIAPMPPNPTLTGDVGNLRIYVRNMARGMENGGITVEPEQKSIDGGAAHGFFVKAHDPNPKLHVKGKDDPFTDGYTGALNVGGKPFLFQVVWNPGSEPDANAALAAMKTLRLR